MDTESNLFCNICNVLLPNEQSKNQHVLGKKHQRLSSKLKTIEAKETCGIFITGFHVTTKLEELKICLSAYGEVVEAFCGEKNSFAIIQFKDPKSVETLLKTKLKFKGKNLHISRRTVKEPEPIKKDYREALQSIKNCEEINDYLKTIQGFDEQIIALVHRLQPNWPEMIQKYQYLCDDLEQVLLQLFPDCIVYPFGSTITRLSFISSDVDVYVRVASTNVPFNDDISKPAAYVRKAKKLLSKYPRKFSRLLAIPQAKTPIVKCVHNPTMISCDFNFKNMLGVCNTSLIQYYLSLDNRLNFLMMTIKYWAKGHDLSSNRGQFSNYSFIMLFIFYLQQGKYLIPPVLQLQSIPHSVCIQEGWNGGFHRMECRNITLQNFSTSEILLGFFDYYANFDYSLNVICPYLGHIVLKTDFLTPECLPKEFESYKIKITHELPLKVDSAVCVQDPFEHNHNITSSVSSKLLDEFISLCKNAAHILRSPINNLTLFKLFTTEPAQSNKVKQIWSSNSYKFAFAMDSTCLSYLNHLANLNSEDELDSDEKACKLRTSWYSLVNEFILNVLTKVLKFNVNLKESENETSELEQDPNIVDSIELICSGMSNLWETRKSALKELKLDNSIGFWEKQVHISDYMWDFYKELKLTEVIIELQFNAYAKSNPVEMHFKVIKINAKGNTFNTFTQFLSKNMSHWFDNYCKELDKNFNK